MTGFEILSVSISGFAVLVSLGSMFVAGRASSSNVKMLKRAGVAGSLLRESNRAGYS